jgi:hypothetical protein
MTVHFWCDAHDPSRPGARNGGPSAAVTFNEILAYAERHCDNPRAAKRILIKEVTKAKDHAGQVAVSSTLAALKAVPQ